MSLKIDTVAASPWPRSTTENKRAAGFEEQLQTFLAGHSSEAMAAGEARLQVHMCQLELARSLFQETTEHGSENMPEMLPLIGTDIPAATWRNFDNHGSVNNANPEITAPSSATTSAPPEIEDLISRAAAEHGVAPDLIRSVIRTESAFDPRAVSPAGAQGLMQLMPETALELGVTNPLDPEQNVMAGTRYLRRLLNRYDGDIDHALAAYNWGMGNVDRHGLEQLPEETRNYLTRVKQA